MDKVIALGRAETFSDQNMMALCDSKVKVVTYTDLAKYSSIEDVLSPWGAAIILYMTKENFGHWVALFVAHADDSSGQTLEFWDSYAIPPDGELAMVPEHFRQISGQNYPHLTAMINSCPLYKRVIYNSVQLQKLKKDVNTCGRWAGLRVAMRNVPLKTFQAMFSKQTFDPDWYASALTLFIK